MAGWEVRGLSHLRQMRLTGGCGLSCEDGQVVGGREVCTVRCAQPWLFHLALFELPCFLVKVIGETGRWLKLYRMEGTWRIKFYV